MMELNLVDALFDLNYLALNCGGQITVGGETLKDETVTVTTAGQITVSEVPQEFSTLGTIGWWSVAGTNSWSTMTFSGNTATIPVTVGQTICVRYNVINDALRQFTVPSAIVPSEVYAVLSAPLFQAENTSFTSSSQVGTLVIEIPRFLLNGSQEFSMNMSGASTTNLAGSALVSLSGGDTCDGGGFYAKIKEIITGKVWYTDLEAMAVDNASFTLAGTGTKKALDVIGVYNGGNTGTIRNANLTFTSDNTAVATVANDGVVTAVGAGEANIEIVATGKAEVSAFANVTVTV